MKLLIGIPTIGNIPVKIMQAGILSILRLAKEYRDIEINFDIVEREIIHNARQQILINAYRSKQTYLLFVDDDMLLESDTIVKLFEYEPGNVGALYCGRQKPYYPILYNYHNKEKHIMVKPDFSQRYQLVDGTGLACNLINQKGIHATAYKSLWDGQHSVGEDVRFWELMKDAGIPCVVDTKTEIGHCTTELKVINYESYQSFNR